MGRQLGAPHKKYSVRYFNTEKEFRTEMLRLTLEGELFNIMFHGHSSNIEKRIITGINREYNIKIENKWFIFISEEMNII